MPQDESRDHSAYTWDPVMAKWVHERGAEVPPPPPPPDVHALQTYFFEPDSKEWIRTVLADHGRQLAAQWRGAHVIPTDGAVPAVSKKMQQRKGSSAPVVFAIVVLLLLVGGAGVVASQTGLLASNAALAPLASLVPALPAPSAAPSVAPSPSESAAPTAAPTTATNGGGGGPARTPTPTGTLPPGLSTRMPDGTAVVYTGPTLVVKPASLAATLTLTFSNGRPASGAVTVLLQASSAVGQIDANGRVAVSLATAPLQPGQYPLQVIYNGTLATVTQISVR